ncbi:MAG: 1,6-anhydro-N-acetylmuramyl-L-alanine amidase AmpD [Burkholderiales bacterium]
MSEPFDSEGWYRQARRAPSPNQDARPPGASPELLVIHHISLPPGVLSGDAVERLFTNTLDCTADPRLAGLESLRVSAHFLVRRRGELLQFVPCEARAWHAGPSSFLGRERCNDFSIGIELEGTGERRYTEPQYRVLAALTRALAARFPLSYLAGHSDIAPGRKTDPGPSFDWSRFESMLDGCGLSRPFPPECRSTPKNFP